MHELLIFGGARQRQLIEKGSTLSIGGEGCQVALPDCPAGEVCRIHAGEQLELEVTDPARSVWIDDHPHRQRDGRLTLAVDQQLKIGQVQLVVSHSIDIDLDGDDISSGGGILDSNSGAAVAVAENPSAESSTGSPTGLAAAPVLDGPTFELIGLDGPIVDKRFALPSGEVVIGRGEEATIRIDTPGLSTRHAALLVSIDRVAVHDCQSRNGTFVDGERISSLVRLAPGQKLNLGKLTLRLQRSGASARFELVGLSEFVNQQRLPLTEGVHRVGRVGAADLLIDHSSISSLHARIEVAGDQITLNDCQSSNGSFVDGERLAEAGVTLRPGQQLAFGKHRFALLERGQTVAEVQAQAPFELEQLDLEGVSYPMPIGTVLIGRRGSATISIDHASISSDHARIEVDEGQIIVHDCESRNGTFIDGQRIVESAGVLPGQQLGFGTLRFRLKRRQ